MALKMFSLWKRDSRFHFYGPLCAKRGVNALYFLGWCLIGAIILAGCGNTDAQSMQQNMSSPSSQSPAPTVAEADLGKITAPAFTLEDQNGKTTSLAQMKGKAVVLTFWYTHCPDMCPLSAEKVHQALTTLNTQVKQVAVLAVSVDPSHDTPASARQFSQAHRLDAYQSWHFLLGSQMQLQPVWKDYHIYTDAAQGTTPQGQAISHMAIVYLIDQQGRERLLLPVNFTPSQLTRNLKILLQNR